VRAKYPNKVPIDNPGSGPGIGLPNAQYTNAMPDGTNRSNPAARYHTHPNFQRVNPDSILRISAQPPITAERINALMDGLKICNINTREEGNGIQ